MLLMTDKYRDNVYELLWAKIGQFSQSSYTYGTGVSGPLPTEYNNNISLLHIPCSGNMPLYHWI